MKYAVWYALAGKRYRATMYSSRTQAVTLARHLHTQGTAAWIEAATDTRTKRQRTVDEFMYGEDA